MLINANLDTRAVVDTSTLFWTPSPIAGIERKTLERDGYEPARWTSLVRYAPDSVYAPHQHPDGEEFLVLEGMLSDEYGDYPAGTYVRNPRGSRHRPFSRSGCTILVKRCQIAADDRARVVVDTHRVEWRPYPGPPGLEVIPLHTHGRERAMMMRWGTGVAYPPHGHTGGEELFVLEGSLSDEFGTYTAGTWVRSPVGSGHAPFSSDGALVLIKVGHLLAAREEARV
jgi:anti-sigma factor ChrR (cupin superfamily)